MNEKKQTTEAVATLEKLVETMMCDAILAAYRMNEQATQKDLARNHVNYGVMKQALKYLRELGHETKDATWEDDGFLIGEKITVNDRVIFKK